MHINITPSIRIFLYALMLILPVISFTACDADFVDKNRLPDVYMSTDTVYVDSNAEMVIAKFDLKDSNKAWQILEFPKFIKPFALSGVAIDGSTLLLPLTIKHDEIDLSYGTYDFSLVINVADVGLLSYTIRYYSYGSPVIGIEPMALNLTNNEHGEFTLGNNGDGILLWKITDTPNWLSFQNQAGSLEPYTSSSIPYNVQTDGMETGEYTSEIVIQNNANTELRLPVKLTVNAFSSISNYQKGELIGSVYLQESNQVIALTKNPNRLLYFSDGESESEEVSLSRVPRCIALSEDQSTLAIGFSNTEISTYNAQSKTLTSTYNIDALPDNMTFGSNEYLYFLSPYSSNESYKYIHSLNLTSAIEVRSQHYEGGIKELIKIPNKDIIITTKTNWSPEFLILYYNTNQGIVDNNNEYRFSPYGLWASDDGERILTGSRKVYNVPAFDPNTGGYSIDGTPSLVGELDLTANNQVHAIATLNTSGLIYVANGDSYQSSTTFLHTYNHSSLAQEEIYEFSSTPPNGYQSVSNWWEKTRSLYPYSNGSKIWFVQEYPGEDYNSPDMWGVRLLELE